MYGVDVIIQRSQQQQSPLQPVVLEVQWAPDCAQALKYEPSFWDQVLGALYLDDRDHVVPI